MSRVPPECRRRGLTLLEVLLSLGLVVLAMSTLFVFYDSVLFARARGTRRINDGSLNRVIAERIADDIRSCGGFLGPLGPGVFGNPQRITIQTVVLPDKLLFERRKIQEGPLPAEADVRQVQYYLAYDPDQEHLYPDGTPGPAPMGLVRREMRTFRQSIVDETNREVVDVELLAPELKYLRFRYFDGFEWIDEWDFRGFPGNVLPHAVEITVGYTELPPPPEEELELGIDKFAPAPPVPYSKETYTTVVKLPQADVFCGSRFVRALDPRRQAQSESPGAPATGGP